MLRVSTRGRYALRAMVDVGLHESIGPVLRQEIAHRQEISANYVAQIFRKLAAVGLLRGVKGPGGGYVLAKPAAEILAGDVVRAIEGPIALVHCVLEEDDAPCHRVEDCVTHRLWNRLSTTLEEILDSVTLQDLIDESCKVCPQEDQQPEAPGPEASSRATRRTA